VKVGCNLTDKDVCVSVRTVSSATGDCRARNNGRWEGRKRIKNEKDIGKIREMKISYKLIGCGGRPALCHVTV
jgi:hypothetical protein